MRSALKMAMTLLTMSDNIEEIGDEIKEMVSAAKQEDGNADKAMVLLEQLGDNEDLFEAFLFSILEIADVVTDIDEDKVQENVDELKDMLETLYTMLLMNKMSQ